MPGFNITNKESKRTLGEPGYNVDPFLQHRWFIRKLGPVGNNPLIFAKDLSLPVFRADKQEVLGSNLYYKFAKNINWQDVTVTFYDMNDTMTELEIWRKKVQNNTKGIGVHGGKDGYKDTCKFSLMNGAGVETQRVTLFNAWPLSIDPGQLDYTDSEVKLVSMVLSYDYAKHENMQKQNDIMGAMDPDGTGYLSPQQQNALNNTPDNNKPGNSEVSQGSNQNPVIIDDEPNPRYG